MRRLARSLDTMAESLHGRDAQVREAERSVRESEEKFRDLFRKNLDPISVNRVPGYDYVDVNDEFLKQSGYTREEVIGRTPRELGIWVSGDSLRRFSRELAAGKPVRSFEADFKTRTGEIRTMLASAWQMEIGGEPCVVSVGRDITEWRKAEALIRSRERELHESETLYRQLVELSPEAILLHADGELVYVNPAAVSLLGASGPENLIGRPVLEIVHPDCRDLALERLHRLEETGGRLGMVETKVVRLDGRVLIVEMDSAAVTYHGESSVLTVLRDVTDRKIAEQRIRESEERFRRIISTIPEVFWMFEPAKPQPWYASPAGEEIYGFSAEEFLANPRRTLECIHPEDQPRVLPILLGQFREPYDVEYRIVRPDGQVRWVRSRSFPELAESGELVRIAGLTEDVTKRKQAEQELVRAHEAVLEASRLKESFLANMSHEIRTPLNVIIGYNSLIEDYAKEMGDESLDPLVTGTRRAGKRLTDTIERILDMSRIVTGGFELRPVPLEIAPFLERETKEFRSLAEAKGLSFCCDLQVSGCRVQFDEHCLSWALANLLDNAIKFTDRGNIAVRLSRDEIGVLCLEVRDTGMGIDESYLPRLFEVFTQEHSGYTRPFEGVGIGLALTKKYIELNGAEISVQSEKGKSSAFTVRFPKKIELTADGEGCPPPGRSEASLGLRRVAEQDASCAPPEGRSPRRAKRSGVKRRV